MHYLETLKGGGIKTFILLLITLLSQSLWAGFNFGECSGSGTFEQQIHKYTNYEDAALVGTIPAGIKGLKVTLVSDTDVDIRLYGENEDKIVHWPYGLLNHYYQETKPYKDVPVTYSGYNGVEGEKGHEFIEVNGTTPTEMTMKAFGYRAGYATVNYSWTGKVGCTSSDNGTGSFTQALQKDTTSLVGTIPPNVENVHINLTSAKDLDIQLYGADGTAIVSWKPTGLMAGATKQSIMYHDMNITWSGYNGTDDQKGNEYITVTPKTSEVLVMKVYGYESGEANVTYSWGESNSDTTAPVITLNGDANLTLHQGDTYVELGATAIDDVDGNVSVDINSTVNSEIVGTYVVTYTAKDSAGNEAKIIRNVNVIKAVSIYGVITTNVYGNTAKYGNTARFQVSLKTKPDTNVSMAVFSSDNNEGIVLSEDKTGRAYLIFGPDNWNIPQTVLVRGQNKNVVNGVQNYRVVLDAMVSDDEHYDGLNPDDIEMKGEELKLLVPTSPQKCIANLSKTLKIETEYNGMKTLVYSLEDAPDGMTIDEKDGKIEWTPTSSDEGNSYIVSVKVTDGSLVSEISFSVAVSEATNLQTQTDGNILSVTEKNSNLKGLKIDTLGNDDSSSINIKIVDESNIPHIPSGITRLSDIFTINTPLTSSKITLPKIILPNGRSKYEISLFNYIASKDGNEYWSSIRTGVQVKETLEGIEVTIDGHNLSGIFFVGLNEVIPNEQTSTQKVKLNFLKKVEANNINCIGRGGEFFIQDCTIPDSEFNVTIYGFGNQNNRITLWGGISVQDLVSWITEVQDSIDKLDMDYNKIAFTIDISPRYNGASWSPREQLNIPLNYTPISRIKSAVAHEYFHHVQEWTLENIDLNNKTARNDRYWASDGDWIWEGTARWFQDYFDDGFESYTKYNHNPLVRVLEKGINNSYTYEYFALWKLIESKCKTFDKNNTKHISLPSIINGVMDTTWGVKTLKTTLSNASCDFGVKFDAVSATESSMESAMYAYQFATVQENDISLLDANEDKNNFKFDPVFELAKTQWIDDTIDIKRGLFMGKVAPYGAVSFRVNYDVLTSVDATPIFWKLKSDKDLLVVFTHLDKNNKGTTVLSSRGKMGLADRFYIPLKGNTEFKFNLLNEDMQGGMLVTLVNTSKDTVNINKLMMHGRFVRDDNKSIVTDYLRGIQWTDGYAGDGAFLYSYHDCSNLTWEGGNWSLPTLPSLNSIVDIRKKSPNPLVYDAFKNIEARGYWADNWDYDLGTSTVVNFMNGANVEIPVDNTMNHICTRSFNTYAATKMSNPNENIYNQVIRD